MAAAGEGVVGDDTGCREMTQKSRIKVKVQQSALFILPATNPKALFIYNSSGFIPLGSSQLKG